jgi:hypothetical protein
MPLPGLGDGARPGCGGRRASRESRPDPLGHRRARWGRPPNAASVRVLEKIGMRLVDSYFDEDGQRDIYRR